MLLGGLMITLRNTVISMILMGVCCMCGGYGFTYMTVEKEVLLQFGVIRIRAFIFGIYSFIMLYITFSYLKSERAELLKSYYEINQLKKKYNAILNNLTEGVIVKSSDKRFDYVNSLGLDLVKKAVELTQN